MNNNWFLSRGHKVLQYQDDAITKVQDSLRDNEKTILAACPSAGKTLMTIYIIEEYLCQYPNNKVIVLAHGTTVLRSQFHDVIDENKPDFTYDLIENSDAYYNSDASVIVSLPQTLRNCKLNKTDLLVVDEAHHFYLSANGKMIKDIIKHSKVTKQLLLTGTPSKFILENLRLGRNEYKIIPVTLNTIFDAGMVSEAYVEVASSTYKFTLDDYNQNDELKTSVHIKSSDTNHTLDDLLDKIVTRLRSFRGNTYANLTPDWKILLKELKKTMIACRSISQAEQVKKYLIGKGIDCALSTSENDVDSLQIKRFKEEDECLILIVVYRGILGFNMPNLVNVVDMTTSHNVDRIYQLFSRVIRIDRNNPEQKKLFFKLAPNMLSDYYKHIMTAVLMLSDDEFFTKFNGKNFNDMVIPVKKINKISSTDSGEGESATNKKVKKYQPIDMEGLPVFEFFKNILHKKDELLTTYAMTTIRDVRAEFMNVIPNGYWTKEKCIDSALKYKTSKEWKSNHGAAYNTARKNNWLDECCGHMNVFKSHLSKEDCINSASKYKISLDWRNGDRSAYEAARRYGWLNECTEHMKVLRKHWTKEDCINSALRYTNKNDWTSNDCGAIFAARKYGWIEECTAHMNKYVTNWTKEMCTEIALNYKTSTEWNKKNSGSYAAAQKNGWLNDCTKHMKKQIYEIP